MIADVVSNKNFNRIVTELFSRVRKLNISLVFISESYFAVARAKNVRLKSINYFITNIFNKWELQKIRSEEILPCIQRQIIEQAKFVYSFSEKAFEKETEKLASAIRSGAINRLIKKMNENKLSAYFHKIWWLIWFVLK